MSHPLTLPLVGDEVIASVYLGAAGTMKVKAVVKVVHANGTLRIVYHKRGGQEVTAECRTWQHKPTTLPA